MYWFVSPATVTMTKLATTIAAPSENCVFHGYHRNMGVTNRNLNQGYQKVHSYDHSLLSECPSLSFFFILKRTKVSNIEMEQRFDGSMPFDHYQACAEFLK